MAVVRDDLGLTKTQIGNTIIASVAITVIVRLAIGLLCERIGPRKAYTWLLCLGSLPVMSIGLADSFESFLLARLAIGAIGASFVITQYHTSVMFAPNVVGTANATTAGWGNLGGGTTQILMPLVFSGILMLGVSETLGWRLAMVVPGIVLFLTGLAYYRFTQDAPDGNFSELRARGELPPVDRDNGAGQSFMAAIKDVRVWALFVVYAACFGVELTINNIAAIYFFDQFDLDLATAGLIAGLFGLMNLFARTLGGRVLGSVRPRSAASRGGYVAVRRHAVRGYRADGLRPDADARRGHRHHADLQPVRADGRRRHLRRGALRQPARPGRGGRYRRRRRQCGRGRRGLPVP
nr:MFS transporter [Salinicola tamaricis]